MTKPIAKALEQIPNRFLLTTVIARRWENLVAGAPPLVEVFPDASPIDIALEEIIQGRLQVDIENHQITLAGQPQVEEREEPLYSSALPTVAKELRDAVAEEGQPRGAS